jgi:hypothetical protein
MEHVDLVKNEWLAGLQHVVARIYLNTDLELQSSEREKWEHLVRVPLTDRVSGDVVDPRQQPEKFFERLHDLLSGDYLFATAVHEEEECPYHERLVVPIERPESTRQAQPA